MPTHKVIAVFALWTALCAAPAAGQGTPGDSAGGSGSWRPWLLGTQINVIRQRLRPVRSPYQGANSLPPEGDKATSHAYGVYAGAEVSRWIQAYLDVEMIRGDAINRATGVAGITNGDVIRQGTVDLGNGPYLARAFVRVTLPLASEVRDTLARAIDQIPSIVSSRRVEITAGKLAVTDLIDVNRYANTTRWQLMNWALFQNSAWDYAADTRGYSNGVAISWINPRWALRVASFQMPTLANGNKFDPDLRRAHGDQVELTLNVPRAGTIVRTLAYWNRARMGDYEAAIAAGQVAGTVPDITADDKPGRTKYGFGLNVEQPIADNGETGLFTRLGWSDGRNETFAFTEVDRHVSLGALVSGAHWGRGDDRFFIAGVHHGIVASHQRYLALGGLGFLLGDGGLTYGPEQILEVNYRAQLTRTVQLTPDIQYIANPGYNRDRGPATVLGLRMNFRY